MTASDRASRRTSVFFVQIFEAVELVSPSSLGVYLGGNAFLYEFECLNPFSKCMHFIFMKRISILKGTVLLIIKFLSPFLNKSAPDVQRVEISKLKIVSAQFGCSSVVISFHVHFLDVHCMSHT